MARAKTTQASLERLWAPWRSTFLAQRGRKACIFCVAKRAPRQDRRYQVVARGAVAFTILNRYPYNNGHVMIAPYRHIGQLERLAPGEWLEMLRLTQRTITKLRHALGPHGWNVGLNLGRTAGAGIPGHLHLHVVPRWNGDTNFFPVLANTKVISQSLEELYAILTE